MLRRTFGTLATLAGLLLPAPLLAQGVGGPGRPPHRFELRHDRRMLRRDFRSWRRDRRWMRRDSRRFRWDRRALRRFHQRNRFRRWI